MFVAEDSGVFPGESERKGSEVVEGVSSCPLVAELLDRRSSS